MCGIYACVNMLNQPRGSKEFRKIARRGPDCSRFVEIVDKYPYSLHLGCHRLQIVGSEKGMQPLEQNGIYLVCNGEIYNYQSLCSAYQLEPTTDTDVEVVLLLYVKLGIERTLELLDGEFAFALIDTNVNKAWCARDRHGVRPLYYTMGERDFILVVSSEGKGTPDFKGVQITPGVLYEFTLDYKRKAIHEREYSSPIPVFETQPKSIDQLLSLSVRKRVNHGDAQVGFLLSGGLDSSLLLAMAMRDTQNTKTVQVFSIGYESGVEESPDLARSIRVVGYLKEKYGVGSINHHIVRFTLAEALSVLPQVQYSLESYDPTTIRASVPMYLLAKYIRRATNVRVLISGEGADELFGGYLYFRYAPTVDSYLLEKKRLLSEIHFFDGLRADRCLSAFGLELRVPFLDQHLVQHVLGTDPNVVSERYQDIEKYVLRKVAEEYLPKEIAWARKEAFSDGVGSSWITDLKQETSKRYKFFVLEWYPDESHPLESIEALIEELYQPSQRVVLMRDVSLPFVNKLQQQLEISSLQYHFIVCEPFSLGNSNSTVNVYLYPNTWYVDKTNDSPFSVSFNKMFVDAPITVLCMFSTGTNDQLRCITEEWYPEGPSHRTRWFSFAINSQNKMIQDPKNAYTVSPPVSVVSTYARFDCYLCQITEAEYYYWMHVNNGFPTDAIPHWWLPKWIDTHNEPSARALPLYQQQTDYHLVLESKSGNASTTTVNDKENDVQDDEPQ